MLQQPADNVPRWTNRQTRRSLALLAFAALLVIALLAAAIVVDQARISNREQTRRVSVFALSLREAYSLLRGMQTSTRGYLLTGDQSLLDLYTLGQDRLPGLWSELQAHAATVGPNTPAQVSELIGVADAWRAAIAPEVARPPNRPQADALEALIRQDRQLFEAVQSRYDALSNATREREAGLTRAFTQLIFTTEVMLALLSLTTFLTLLYCMWLVRRIGLFANRLQIRQERQHGYTRAISAMNGPTQLQPLVDQALPIILESVGAQAGVVYTHIDSHLSVAGAVGLDTDQLTPLKSGEGLPGAALQQNQVVTVTDLPEDTPYRIHTGIGVGAPCSVVNLPLRFGHDMLGVLTAASVNRLGDTEIQQLSLTASQLATALSNVRAFEETQRQREELAESNAHLARLLERSTTLQEMGRELAAERDLQTLLELVCHGARRLLRADYSGVATVVDGTGSTRWMAVDGVVDQDVRDTVVPPHAGIIGRVIDGREPVALDNSGENQGVSMDDVALHVAERTRAVLGVPLFRGTTPIGALIVAFCRPHTISAEEIDLATALAAYASVASENARLLSELSAERDRVARWAIDLQEKNLEVERANRLKSEFVANMSHELRTPLNSILALAQILADRLDGDLTEEQAKQVAIIERNARTLLGLINDILDLSKIEAGKLDLLPTEFSVRDVVQGVRQTVAPLLLDKDLEFDVELAPDLPRLRTDENKLKQVLLNLLSNAIKFTEHGRVSLRVAAGRADSNGSPSESRKWVTFQVVDTGIGIAPEDQAEIWQEFRQIDGSLARRYEGTGLGLAIVRRLVTLLGGTIGVESRVGEGSIFTFSIPVDLPVGPHVLEDLRPSAGSSARMNGVFPSGDSQDGRRAPEQTRDKPLVLVVDDDPEAIYILEKYLRDDGFEIAVARSGDEAIDKARLLRPFAMTLDVMLPGRDGWEVIQELKADPQTTDIPIIMLSMLDNRQLGYSLGAAEYLVKPVSRKDLLERLAHLHAHAPLHHALVVEDDVVEQRILALVLREAGLEVTSFTSGTAALEWLAEHTPDLITLDLMVPGMDGFQVLDEIKQRAHLRTVPVLIITAKEILPEERARLNSRIAAIIQKGPAQRDAILQEIREQLRRRREQLAAVSESQ